MQAIGNPTLFFEYHCYKPSIGMETLWFYRVFNPDGPAPADDPHAIKLIGPASQGECASVAKCVRLVLQALGHEVEESHGADD
jgi:hypothetical protein